MDYKDMGWLPAKDEETAVPKERLEEAVKLARTDEFPSAPSTLTGNIRVHHDMPSRFLEASRHVIVYLPPDYEKDAEERYPVFYLQDGQNLFDAATAFVPGHDWKADETAEALIGSGQVAPVIIVGVYHAGASRIEEYTPNKAPRHPKAGKARLYGRFLTEELKPLVDSMYRTRSGPSDTAIGGSSLGGLAALFTALNYSDIFGNLAVLSASVWWNRMSMVKRARALERKLPIRIWLDMGTEEGVQALRSVRGLRAALLDHGWVENEDLHYEEVEGGQHSEDDWAIRFGDVLRWLFPGPNAHVEDKPEEKGDVELDAGDKELESVER